MAKVSETVCGDCGGRGIGIDANPMSNEMTQLQTTEKISELWKLYLDLTDRNLTHAAINSYHV